MTSSRAAATVRALFIAGLLGSTYGCSGSDPAASVTGTDPTATDEGSSGGGGAGASGVEEPSNGNGGGSSSGGGADAGTLPDDGGVVEAGPPPPSPTNGIQDGNETDVDCGGTAAPKCTDGKKCVADADCDVACNYAGRCVIAPSCKPHLGGDTCGQGEVGEAAARHESCCRSLPVAGFVDASRPGKTVYLDKFEITAGRVRAWIEQLTAAGGNPDVKGWIARNRPPMWNASWDAFLPTDFEGGSMTIARRLLGDPRPEDSGTQPGPGVILPPPTDQVRQMGVNYQFGSAIYVDLHGNNCGTWAGAYGFPTYWYPADILSRDMQQPRPDGLDRANNNVPAKELLDVKSMNCITNVMLAAFCAWDGGQLATDEVLDFVTATPATLANTSGCGTQYDHHGELLGNVFTNTVQTGGRCAAVSAVNATFDAGDALPVPGSPLNNHVYRFPNLGATTSDKAWQIAAPGRVSADQVRLNPAGEPWMDLNGNLNEAALDTTGATFGGAFALKYRGIGYGSSRSDLNMTLIRGENVIRIRRPEAKAAYSGGRCMRFK